MVKPCSGLKGLGPESGLLTAILYCLTKYCPAEVCLQPINYYSCVFCGYFEEQIGLAVE